MKQYLYFYSQLFSRTCFWKNHWKSFLVFSLMTLVLFVPNIDYIITVNQLVEHYSNTKDFSETPSGCEALVFLSIGISLFIVFIILNIIVFFILKYLYKSKILKEPLNSEVFSEIYQNPKIKNLINYLQNQPNALELLLLPVKNEYLLIKKTYAKNAERLNKYEEKNLVLIKEFMGDNYV